MRAYRLATVVLGLALAGLGLAMAFYHSPGHHTVAVPEAYFARPFWIVLFGVPGLTLAYAAASWRPGLVMLCHAALFGGTTLYTLCAASLATFEHQGWQVVARSAALAAAHLCIILCGPPMDRRLDRRLA